VRVAILGPVEIEQDGRRTGVGGERLRALLARLALEPGRPVSTGRIVDAVWEEEPPGDQAHALQSLVSRLRRSLGHPALLAPAAGGYRLAIEPGDVDAHRFETRARAGSATLGAGDPAGALPVLREALAEWRGPALADLAAYRFAATEASRLTGLRLDALADRVEAELALGPADHLVGELEGLVAEDPLHERLAGQLVTVLYGAGRQADALAAYERTRARLADELGVPPSPALQAVHLGVLRGDLAPARAERRPDPAPPPRSNLPAPVTSFVGRTEELAHIEDALAAGRLVTLIGPGGAGKTRLAQQAAAPWAERLEDGVWLVELAPVTAEAELVPAVLGALGLREAALIERPGQPPPREGLERLLDALAPRETLIVLDNCEHLVASAAAMAEQLLAGCPRLRVLATSREPLAIAGERLAGVPPLGFPAPDADPADALGHPAVRLFADRAAAASPGFAVDAATVAPTVEICARLDGLPLALELAAARLRSLPVEQVAARLDDRFRLLTGGSRTALPRHRTLRAVVDWSWDLLDDDERVLARRLAVFPAGATAAAAAAVCADGAPEVEVLDALSALADRSLLVAVPGADPPRFSMLETIREYGAERLVEAGELEAVRTAHARWFAALAAEAEPRLRRADQIVWYHRLEAERENVLAGLRHLADTGDARRAFALAGNLLWFFMLSGSPGEAQATVEVALAAPGEADPLDRLVAEGVRSLTEAGAEGPDADPGELRRRLGALADQLEPVDTTERPLLAMARTLLPLLAGDADTALRRVDEAGAHPDPWVRTCTELLRAGMAENAGELGDMRGHLDAALAGFRALGDRWGMAIGLTLRAGTAVMHGDLDAADIALEEAREQLDELDPAGGVGIIALRLADVALRRGDLPAARRHATEARDRREVGSDDRAFASAMLARVLLAEGDPAGARAELTNAAERLGWARAVRPEFAHAQTIVLAVEATVRQAGGDLDGAEPRVAEAFERAVATSDMPLVATVGVVAADAAARRGRAAEAAEMVGAAEVLRGAEDATNPDVADLRVRLAEALGEDALAAALARGRALSREDALARLDPASRASPVGP
jgi:predicted ATPase/DNA-binding SARP family transcriptional activator